MADNDRLGCEPDRQGARIAAGSGVGAEIHLAFLRHRILQRADPSGKRFAGLLLGGESDLGCFCVQFGGKLL